MQFRPSYLLGLNELVGLAYVQNLGLLMKRAPGFYLFYLFIFFFLKDVDDVAVPIVALCCCNGSLR